MCKFFRDNYCTNLGLPKCLRKMTINFDPNDSIDEFEAVSLDATAKMPYYLNSIFWNVQGLFTKIDSLKHLFDSKKVKVIVAIAEHWLNDSDIVQLTLPNFKCASYYCRPTRLHGGVAIFVHEDVNFKEIHCVKMLSIEMVCEVIAVELTDEKIIFLSLYRPYNNAVDYFNNLSLLSF